jgi:phospholipid transport system substrate-binding protein
MKKLYATLLIVFGLASGMTAAHAVAAETATKTIQKANERLRELLAKKETGIEAKVASELRGLFDIGDLTQRALVDHWAKMTVPQREAIVGTLRDIVEKNYLGQLKNNLEYEIGYVSEEPKGSDVIVKTVIKAKRQGRPIEIPVDYVLRQTKDGWRAYDVITDGVSILDNYRSQFNKIIAKEGVDGLIARMKKKLDKGSEK